MDENKSLFYIVAIVAIIAIFGMVFMAISANNVAKSSSTQKMLIPADANTATDSTGQASIVGWTDKYIVVDMD